MERYCLDAVLSSCRAAMRDWNAASGLMLIFACAIWLVWDHRIGVDAMIFRAV